MNSESHCVQEADGSAATELSVSGMTCRNCARHVSEALQAVQGVDRVAVSLEEGRASVRWRPDANPNPEALAKAVEAEGFQAKPLESQTPKKSSIFSGWGFNLILGAACTIPLISGEWIFALGMQRWFQWLAFGLALPVQVLCGARFYRGAWNQLKAGASSMDTLVALGSTTAFGYSVWALFQGAAGHLYFMEAAAIITLISAGHWMEERMSRRAEGSLRALLHLAPQTARLRTASGIEKEVPVSSLRPKDIVSLRPGDRVPTDAQLAEGQTTVDESMLTGESIPVDKAPGELLYAGTINLNGQVLMRVTATGEATALARIIAAVQRAQNSRAQIQRLADRVSSVFVPIVVLVALATGLWWGLAPVQAKALHGFLSHYLWAAHVPPSALTSAIICAAAVLIVACPCAMGLATPTAIMAGTNAAARRGILIRDGRALERAGQITAVVFDKTGTLTHGKPVVVDSSSFDTISDKASSLRWAAALARGSSHPLSQAVSKLSSNDLPFQKWQEAAGSGLQAELTPKNHERPLILRLGSLGWLRRSGVDDEAGTIFAEKWMSQGATVLGLSADSKLILSIALQDTLKPGASEVVREIAQMNLRSYLITGDNPRTAQAIAREAGIPEQHVFAEVRPEQKAELVQRLKRKGERIAFVGDGINDAPALKQADLGIAVSQASDVATEAADLILLRSDIHAIPEAIDLARASLRTIKQNLFWAFFYNTAAIPLAALGFLSPVLCAAAMGLSDVVVIGNALRLARRSRPHAGKARASHGP